MKKLRLLSLVGITSIALAHAGWAAGLTFTTTYEPGKIIVVGSESAHDTFSYVLDKTVRYVNKAGREIDEHLIKSGTRIHVYYDGTGENRVVNRVMVDEN